MFCRSSAGTRTKAAELTNRGKHESTALRLTAQLASELAAGLELNRPIISFLSDLLLLARVQGATRLCFKSVDLTKLFPKLQLIFDLS